MYIELFQQKTKDLELDSVIFRLLGFLLLSLITILTISQIAQITALIEVPLLIFYFIFIVIAAIQGYSFIQSYSYKKDAESKIAQNQQLREYLQNIEQQYEELRHFKHDYHNMLLSLEEFTKKDNQEEFREYYRELVHQNPVNKDLKKLTVGKIERVHNDPIKGLIIQKFFSAQNQGVELALEIDGDIEIRSENNLSLVRIIGILLDNAIEHTVKEEEKTVICHFETNRESTIVIVANPAKDLKNIDQLFKSGYTSKVDHQGFGLANVAELVQNDTNLYLEKDYNKGILKITIIILHAIGEE